MTTRGQGPAVATWDYHIQYRWLMSKQDEAGQGADYIYTPEGRLKTREWNRGVVTM